MHDSEAPRKSVGAQSRGAGPLLALMGGNVALAFGPWFVRLADVGPVAAGFWRLALAAPILLAIAHWRGGRPFADARGLGWVLLIAGLAFAGDLASWHLGILRTTLANSTLFGNSATLFFPIYGFVIARAWPNRIQALALALAALGAGLLLGRSYEASPQNLVGDLLCLLAGMLYTVYFALMMRARERLAPFSALALSTLASAPPLLIVALAMGETVWPTNWSVLAGLALMSQVIGQGLMIYALGHLPPLLVGIALLSQPVIAATIGWFAYGEALGAADLIGAALVAAALVLVRLGPPVAPPLEKRKAG